MAKFRIFYAGVFALALLILPAALGAQEQSQEQSASESKTHDVLAHLEFRDLGPATAGGRVAAVAGVPGNPNVYYVGAGGGGVWKALTEA